MRITKKIFTDLAIYMIGFGVLIGILFPIFTRIIGIPAEYIDIVFIIACVVAGVSVGVINIILTRITVGRRLKILSSHMKHVNDNLRNIHEIDIEECMKDCVIEVDSEDEIGEASESFNTLVKSFLTTLQSETSIRNFTEIFTNELDVLKLSDKALDHLITYTESSAGVMVVDINGEVKVSSSYLIKNPNEVVNLEIISKAFSDPTPKLFELPEGIIVEAGLIDFKPKSILLVPITYKNATLGVILLASTNTYSEDIIDELNTYTHGLSLGMSNATTHDKLEQLAILDPLTKVHNRRFGIERLKEEYSRSVRQSQPFGILMLDIDYFKNINDTYGHLVGDKVLVSIANIIRNNVRKEDILIRYGGEEFMAVLPGATENAIKVVGEKIRRFVEEHIVRHNNQEIKVTISLGGASYPETKIEKIEDLIQIADDNLYTSKETGRNKVTV